MESLIVFKTNERLEQEVEKFKNKSNTYVRLNDLIDKSYEVEFINCTDRFILTSEEYAKSYYGGSCLYLNKIYCEDDVDIMDIYKLFWACIREYNRPECEFRGVKELTVRSLRKLLNGYKGAIDAIIRSAYYDGFDYINGEFVKRENKDGE